MNKPPDFPAPKVNHAYTVASMQKLAEEMLHDPELGRRSRVVSVLDSGGRKHGAITMPKLPRYGFGYIITSI